MQSNCFKGLKVGIALLRDGLAYGSGKSDLWETFDEYYQLHNLIPRARSVVCNTPKCSHSISQVKNCAMLKIAMRVSLSHRPFDQAATASIVLLLLQYQRLCLLCAALW